MGFKKVCLKDNRPFHMVKLVGAVRNFRGNIKHLQIDVEDGTRLVRVILWRNKRECTTQHCLLNKCNSNCYIRVMGEVKDYYGVHKIIAFNVWLVSSGNEVTHHFLEVAYSFEKRLELVEDEMLRAVPL
jgi:replication factor A2